MEGGSDGSDFAMTEQHCTWPASTKRRCSEHQKTSYTLTSIKTGWNARKHVVPLKFVSCA